MTAFILLNPWLSVLIAGFIGVLLGGAFVHLMWEVEARQQELIHTRGDDHENSL